MLSKPKKKKKSSKYEIPKEINTVENLTPHRHQKAWITTTLIK